MIFPIVLVLTLTLTNGEVVTYPLAPAVTTEQCEAIGDTYVDLGPVLPKEAVASATLSCQPADEPEAITPTNYPVKWQKVPGAAI